MSPRSLLERVRYVLWGNVSRFAIYLSFKAPREYLRDEAERLQRYATKRAHTCRKHWERLEGEP